MSLLEKPILKSLIFITCLVCLGGCGRSPDTSVDFNYTDITGAKFAREFELTNHHGDLVSLNSFQGKVVVLFFGFMNCPDICPTTLTELNEVMVHLGADAERAQVLFVTVDPERDSVENLKAYMSAFNPKFLGLWGTEDEISEVAQEFKVVYQKVAGSIPTIYSVDHSAGTFVFDPLGHVRLFVPYCADPAKLSEDIKQLMNPVS